MFASATEIANNPLVQPRERVGDAPRVLLMTAHHWPTTTRLAFALSEAGFTVEALCPPRHSLERMKFVSKTHYYNALTPIRSLRDAIRASKPELIIPSDDYLAGQTNKLYTLANDIDANGDELRALIAYSLGDPEHYPIFYSRTQIALLARAVGVPSPTATIIANTKELSCELTTIGFPAVLKLDGSWGGTGVAIINNQTEADRAFRKFAAQPRYPANNQASNY